ncbi:MAG: NAD(P)H-dependent oxidoreductase subunit E [Opitutaceae bacterium]|jgi:NADH-quinone oxidoreductase subunit E|nr:NAD(P)H-dependent oxidoreductase subunit E [Opitutaceae bacterium]
MNLKPETLLRIDEVITHYPVRRSAMLPLLHLIQEDIGHIPDEAIEWVAARLGLQPVNVYEVVTFYPMFKRRPVGRRHIKVCRTLSCALMGGYKICGTFQKEFGVGLDEVTPDGEVSIEFVECLASCGTAPVVMIDDDLHENVTPEKARALAAQIKAGAASRPAPPPAAV